MTNFMRSQERQPVLLWSISETLAPFWWHLSPHLFPGTPRCACSDPLLSPHIACGLLYTATARDLSPLPTPAPSPSSGRELVHLPRRPGCQLTTSVREEDHAAVAAAAAGRGSDSAAIGQRSPRQSVRCSALRAASPRLGGGREGWRDGGGSARGAAPASQPPAGDRAPPDRFGLLGSASYPSLVTDHLQHLCAIRTLMLVRRSLTNYTILNGRRPSRERHDDLDDSDDTGVYEEGREFICRRQNLTDVQQIHERKFKMKGEFQKTHGTKVCFLLCD
ncbi:uncharacterized protein LOC129399766 [Sorex araneus]|uniref:uncharacterized protein LOC129399766 n=1 Tax=Sorex araneus TaxID=42254 RepID=UPI002433E472|nr:uncharacterized protein LOC129399766 [Sorex araneus]